LADDINANVLDAEKPAVFLPPAVHPLSRLLRGLGIALPHGEVIGCPLKLGHQFG
jgi:hypothetical protein